MPITPEVIDQILKDYEKPEDLLSENGLLQQLTKALVERALSGELTNHLGYEKHSSAGDHSGNSRNGSTPKTIKGKRGQIDIEVPRDRNGEFEPQLVKKNQTRFDGLDDKILSLYSFPRIMSVSKVFLHSSLFLRAFLLPLLIGILPIICFAQHARQEIGCQLSLDDRLLEVKMTIPASKQAKTGFRISDWAGVNNYADNIYRVCAANAKGNNLTLERTDDRTWIVGGNKQPFTLSYEVVSQKDSFMGTNSRGQFHPTLFRDYAFLWGKTFLLQPTEDEIAELPVNLKTTPGSYRVTYSNLEGRVKSFNDFSDLFLAAGNYRASRRLVAGRNVQFIMQGDK